MKATTLGLAIAGTLLLVACSREQPAGAPRQPEPTTAAPAEKTTPAEPAAEGAAQIAPTQGNTVTGSVALSTSSEGVHITGSIQGLKPNAEFGFHVHEKGDCSAPDGSSAGGHFNPTQAEHGNPSSGTHHHAGDMLNIKSNGEGVAQVDTTAAGTTLHGNPATDIMGKAIVVHEGPDDYTTQPSGNSGKRVACGVIGAAGSP
jgi:Cu-Zn family superoxide dismutase